MKTSLLLQQKLKKNYLQTGAHSEPDPSPVGAWGAELKSSGIFLHQRRHKASVVPEAFGSSAQREDRLRRGTRWD